jgi:hypothetical protein
LHKKAALEKQQKDKTSRCSKQKAKRANRAPEQKAADNVKEAGRKRTKRASWSEPISRSRSKAEDRR